MNSVSIPLNTWLSIAATWRPQLPVAHSIAQKFLFHHIRPMNHLNLAAYCADMKNDIQTIDASQISLIAVLSQDIFICTTVTSPMLDKFNARYHAMDYQDLVRHQQAGLWHIPVNNLFLGSYQVFNGPNAIDITR